jgi:hypothetical protein
VWTTLRDAGQPDVKPVEKTLVFTTGFSQVAPASPTQPLNTIIIFKKSLFLIEEAGLLLENKVLYLLLAGDISIES